ncbi:VOC family protein [Companilactobacillus sp. DQM5]|uniref:VOC family protein n=1 Tax=Companilactobacillus sp. DQM5 TaxID=3463359 RepID=UPI0040588B21
MKLHHITLLTKDVSKNSDFYIKILGFRLVKNSINQENPHMRHVFYGDYMGSIGMDITFIEVPRLGQRTDEDSYIQGVDFYAPLGSEEFWQNRLTHFNIPFSFQNNILSFKDFEDVPLSLNFINEHLPEHLVNTLSDISRDNQIIRFKNSNIYVNDMNAEKNFFETLTSIKFSGNILPLDDNQTITLIQSSNPGRKRMGRGSIDHIALSVLDKSDITRVKQLGLDSNFEYEEDIDRKFFYSLYFKDPNHNRIEFATSYPGMTVDEPLDFLGQHLSLPDRLEPERLDIEKFYAEKGINF